MLNSAINYFTKIVGAMAGVPAGDLSFDKIKLIIQGLLFAGLFIAAFSFFYLKFSKNHPEIRRIFFWTAGILFLIIIAKYGIYHFWKGYIPDRLLFYAVSSPKAINIFWFLAPVAVFSAFLYLRKKIESFSAIKFLLCLWLVFIIFSLSVAAIREGIYSIYEPFTRSYWEPAGNLLLVQNVSGFLHDYTVLQPKLAIHSATHPPGYTLILYLFQKLGAGLLGMSILVVMLGGLIIFPLYFLLKRFADEDAVRRGLEIFIFLPGLVMFSATSMETVFLFSVWLAMAVLYIGWERGALLSFIGGLLAAFALFQNFLFLLLAPLFIMLFLYKYLSLDSKNKKIILTRLLVSILGFLVFFAALRLLTGYSVIENFWSARHFNANLVESNFESVFIYATYFIMNILAFGIYLGLSNVLNFIKKIKSIFIQNYLIILPGLAMTLLFLLIGIFQGEVERIWLFLTPLFILPFIKAISKEDKFLPAIISLAAFQIIIIQILFYTYW